MKIRHVLFLAPLLLQGCFFVWIPGSVVNAVADGLSGAEGAHCVSSTAKVGDQITVNGTTWRVVSLSGTSTRCREAIYPIRAKLEQIPS
jgi:hypothetical protein